MSSSTCAQDAQLKWSNRRPSSGGLVWHLVAQLGKWHAKRKAFAELSALDDRMLRDIGLDRSEISSVLSDSTGERRIGPARRPDVTRI